MPIDSSFRPLRAAILAVSAKCGAGASSAGGMHISPSIVEPVVVAAALQERIGVLRQHAGLLRLGAGVDLDEQQRPAALLGDFLRQRLAQARPVDRMDGVETAPPPPSPCSIAAARSCAARARDAAPASAGHFALASCTRFSPNTRWPAAITGSMASAANVFDTATSVTPRRIARAPRGRRARSPSAPPPGRLVVVVLTVHP